MRWMAAAVGAALLLLGPAALGAAQDDGNDSWNGSYNDSYEDWNDSEWNDSDWNESDWNHSDWEDRNRSREHPAYRNGSSSYERENDTFTGDHVRFTLDEDLPGVRGYGLVDGPSVFDAVALPASNDTDWMTHDETFAMSSGPHDMMIRDNASYRLGVDVEQDDDGDGPTTAVVAEARLDVADDVEVERNDSWSDDDSSVYDLRLPDDRVLHLWGDSLEHRDGVFRTAEEAVLGARFPPGDPHPDREERPRPYRPSEDRRDRPSQWDRDGDTFTGDRVRFTLDEDLPGIRDHGLRDPATAAIASLRLPEAGELRSSADGRLFTMGNDAAQLMVADVPPAVLGVTVQGNGAAEIVLASGVSAEPVEVEDDDAPEDARLYELRLPDNRTAWLGGEDLERTDRGFRAPENAHFRAMERPGDHEGREEDRVEARPGPDDGDGPPRHALDREARTQVQRAAASGKVGVEVHPGEGGPAAVAGGHVQVRQAYGGPDDEVKAGVTVEAPDGSEGTVIRMTLNQSALPDVEITEAVDRLEVHFDNESIAAADDLEDALDWSDDGGEPEYLILVGAEEVEILVTVPHFSPHTVEVVTSSDEASAQGTPGFGALAALVAGTGVAAASRRRR